ncbi:Glycine betaine/choline transport system permease protein OusW [Halodesulfovibrio sp. MK-HDV]|nr:Glycine betaine/choline transport system permease protein OusW [Halodesulfovibrio sp. MK-HDV]
MLSGDFIPLDESIIPLSEWISEGINWLVYNFRDFFQVIKIPVEVTLTSLTSGLTALPFYIPIILIALLAWKFSGKRLAIFFLAFVCTHSLFGAVGSDHDDTSDGHSFGSFLCNYWRTAWRVGRP